MRKTRNIDAIEYLLAIFTIFEGNSMFNIYTGHFQFKWVCCLLTVLLFCSVVFLKRINKVIVLGVFLWMMFFWSIQVTSNGIGIYRTFEFVIGTTLMTYYFLVCKKLNRAHEFWNKVANVVFILCIISFVLWIFGPILNILSPNVHISHATWAPNVTWYDGYYNLLFEAQREDGTFLEKGAIWRNSSIFAEAPMFNLWIVLSLFYEMFLRGEVRKTRNFVYLLSIVTAMSSTGIIIFAMMLFCKAFKLMQQREHTPWYMYVLLILVIVGAYFTIDYVMDAKSETGSYAARMNDYAIGFAYFLNHPMSGLGYVETDSQDIVGSSNTLIVALGKGGLPIGLLMTIPLLVLYVRGLFEKNNLYFSTAVFFSCVLYTILIGHNYLFVIIMAYNISMAFTNIKHAKQV